MLVCLPFDPEHLLDPPDFEYVVADACEHWPAQANAAEFYVPTYRFDRRPLAAMAGMDRLAVVQTLTAGVDNVLPLLPDGVTLCNAAGVHDAATSELAVGLMIAAQRDFASVYEGTRLGRWTTVTTTTSSVADRRVLVIGAGSIGQAIRRRLAGFECAVTMVGRSARVGVRARSELPDLLPTAEIVVLVVPLSEQTRGMVDAGFLAAMPDGALLVNVARGAVVDTDALVDELAAGRLRAALDVTDPEPLPHDHPLWSAPGLVVSHHRGGASSAMWPRAYALVSDQLRRLAAGLPLRNVVAGPALPPTLLPPG